MTHQDGVRKAIGARAWTQSLLAVVTVLGAIHGPTGRAEQASEDLLTEEPILRVEAGPQHSAQINRIDTDALNRFAVTASWDKTVRVWSLPDGGFLKVLRFPLDSGNTLGKSHAVAISPDARSVAVGGDSGGVSRHNIFLFDRVSGDLTKRLSGVPGGVLHLAYSPDGKFLAASLEGSNGIRVFDVGKGYELLPSDKKYYKSSYWATFDRAGRLVTTSDDGFVRLYAADHFRDPIRRFKLRDDEPYAAAFSPDGTRVAVGYFKPTKVLVLSGSNLTQLFKANTDGSGYENLKAVAWSQDGRFLFAGGEWSGHGGMNQVRRWSKDGHGEDFFDIPVEDISIMEILGLKSGSMLFLHTDGFGLIGPDTKLTKLQPHLSGLDLMSGFGGPLRVSADGRTVQVDTYQPRHAYRFTVGKSEIEVDPREDEALLNPITHDAPGLVVNWSENPTPTVNGAPITLKPDEWARSMAIVAGAERFVLGADWSLRLLDRQGHEVWANAVPGEAWHVNVTPDGRLVVVAFGDGTIRWFRLEDGIELLALFIHPDGKRWVVWTPQGYYDAGTGGDELIGWHVNHGYDNAPVFSEVWQFRDRFNRRDVIQRVLETLDVEKAVRAADQEAHRPINEAAISVSTRFPPDIKISSPPVRNVFKTELDLSYVVRLHSPEDTLHIEVRVDGVKWDAHEEPLVDKGDRRSGDLRIKEIPRHDSTVSVSAHNANGYSKPASIDVRWHGTGTDPKPKLYVLAIGISDYKDKNRRLQYAAKDADDFVKLAKRQKGGHYEDVVVYPPLKESLTDNEATREAIRKALDWIKHTVTDRNDVAMVFLAGHGDRARDGNYQFLPYDYDDTELSAIQDWELRANLKGIAGKKIFFLDTCHSGAVVDVDNFNNDLKAPENSVVVFASSQGTEESHESPEWNNGAFTKAVLDGLRGNAAPPEDTKITENELKDYVEITVRKLTDNKQNPHVALPPTIKDFTIAERLP